MKDTGRIVVSADGHSFLSFFRLSMSLFLFTLHEGSLIEEEIKSPCNHNGVNLLGVSVVGHEYLALSCHWCQNIKLLDLNKHVQLTKGNGKGQSSCELKKIQNEVITAFSGEYVYRMIQGEQNRLFVEIGNGKVLELDTSTTTFTTVRSINTGWGPRGVLCAWSPQAPWIQHREGNVFTPVILFIMGGGSAFTQCHGADRYPIPPNGSYTLHWTRTVTGTGKCWVPILRYVLYTLYRDRSRYRDPLFSIVSIPFRIFAPFPVPCSVYKP